VISESDDANPPPLPPEHPLRPSIMLHNDINDEPVMLHDSINNSIEEHETICNGDCDNNYDTAQQEVGNVQL